MYVTLLAWDLPFEVETCRQIEDITVLALMAIIFLVFSKIYCS